MEADDSGAGEVHPREWNVVSNHAHHFCLVLQRLEIAVPVCGEEQPDSALHPDLRLIEA